jgi:hypothetical protein
VEAARIASSGRNRLTGKDGRLKRQVHRQNYGVNHIRYAGVQHPELVLARGRSLWAETIRTAACLEESCLA